IDGGAMMYPPSPLTSIPGATRLALDWIGESQRNQKCRPRLDCDCRVVGIGPCFAVNSSRLVSSSTSSTQMPDAMLVRTARLYSWPPANHLRIVAGLVVAS